MYKFAWNLERCILRHWCENQCFLQYGYPVVALRASARETYLNDTLLILDTSKTNVRHLCYSKRARRNPCSGGGSARGGIHQNYFTQRGPLVSKNDADDSPRRKKWESRRKKDIHLLRKPARTDLLAGRADATSTSIYLPRLAQYRDNGCGESIIQRGPGRMSIKNVRALAHREKYSINIPPIRGETRQTSIGGNDY